MVLKRFTGSLGSVFNKRPGQDDDVAPDLDTPEANASRGVRLFCESGAANSLQGEEVLHLPTIVEAAVASPTAAAAACNQIRKFLSKENYSRPHVQYNAVMLIRILADNPGQSFTKNMDKQFADTVKHLLRNGRDPSVSQILRETLEALDREKAYDTNLSTVFAMWRKEKGLMAQAGHAPPTFGPRTMNAPPWDGQAVSGGFGSSNGGGSRSRSKGLPPPAELAGRIEEARTSAKLLLQLVQSTPPNELLGNELIKEFSERCQSAQRSIQGYINAEDPSPDDDTMLTLIETNEQLSLAASKHQRAILGARRLHGGATPSPPIPSNNNNPLPTVPVNNSYEPPPVPPPNQSYNPPPGPPRTEAPILPPVNVGSDEYAKPSSHPNASLPASLQAAPNQRAVSQASSNYTEDPFADHHSSGYTAPPGPPPPPPRQVNPREQEEDDPRYGGDKFTGSPTSYHPGYQSTPSYIHRQESSTNNLTMHGASTTPPPPQRQLTEEEEYARDYPARSQPTTPERTRDARRRNGSDVSPIAERGAVTYRY